MNAQPIIQMFYNPRSGSFSQAAFERLIAAMRGEGAEVMLTVSVDRTPAIDPRATHLCIAGGDGTIRHVAAMLVSRGCRLPVAIYPAGTVNLLARDWLSRPEPSDVARELIQGCVRRRHIPVSFGDSMFFACASIGPDGAAVDGLSPRVESAAALASAPP